MATKQLEFVFEEIREGWHYPLEVWKGRCLCGNIGRTLLLDTETDDCWIKVEECSCGRTIVYRLHKTTREVSRIGIQWKSNLGNLPWLVFFTKDDVPVFKDMQDGFRKRYDIF